VIMTIAVTGYDVFFNRIVGSVSRLGQAFFATFLGGVHYSDDKKINFVGFSH